MTMLFKFCIYSTQIDSFKINVSKQILSNIVITYIKFDYKKFSITNIQFYCTKFLNYYCTFIIILLCINVFCVILPKVILVRFIHFLHG